MSTFKDNIQKELKVLFILLWIGHIYCHVNLKVFYRVIGNNFNSYLFKIFFFEKNLKYFIKPSLWWKKSGTYILRDNMVIKIPNIAHQHYKQ